MSKFPCRHTQGETPAAGAKSVPPIELSAVYRLSFSWFEKTSGRYIEARVGEHGVLASSLLRIELTTFLLSGSVAPSDLQLWRKRNENTCCQVF